MKKLNINPLQPETDIFFHRSSKEYPNVLRWYKLIAKRPAVIKGYNVVGEYIKIPLS